MPGAATVPTFKAAHKPSTEGQHRARLIAAMAASVERKGYRSTSVADVVGIARTSRRTFYEHFDDRAACYLALFEATTGEMSQAIARAVQFDAKWEDLVDAAVGAYLDNVAAHPALFASFTHELPALGRAGVESARAAGERFVELLVALAEAGMRERPDVVARPLERDTAVIIVGGLRELIVSALEQRREVSELRASATAAVKAIVRAAVLEAQPEVARGA